MESNFDRKFSVKNKLGEKGSNKYSSALGTYPSELSSIQSGRLPEIVKKEANENVIDIMY